MKQWKKMMMILLCAGAVMSVTACGSDQQAQDNVADDHMTTDENRNNTEDNVNDATEHTGEDNGVMDEIGDDVRDEADQIGDDIRDGDDDLMDDAKTRTDR